MQDEAEILLKIEILVKSYYKITTLSIFTVKDLKISSSDFLV